MNIHTFNPQGSELFEGKYVVVYHAYCSDGIFSAAATALGMARSVNPITNLQLPTQEQWSQLPQITFVDYSFEGLQIDHLLDKNTTLYFVDICIDDIEVIKHLCDISKQVVSLDHHDDSMAFVMNHIDELPKNFHNLNSKVRSGAWLAWEHFCSGTQMPNALKFVDDRDRWVFDLPESKPFHEYVVTNVLSQPTMQLRLEAALRVMSNTETNTAVSVGQQLIAYRDALINTLISELNIVEVVHLEQTLKCAIIHAPYPLISESCSQLMKRHSHVDIVCAVYVSNNGGFGYSFRCRKEHEDRIQVNKIAQMFGGGGHKAAAGAANIGTVDFTSQLLEKLV